MNLRAADVKRLLADEAFIEILSRVKQQQIDVFTTCSRQDEATLKDAKYMLTAIGKIEQALHSVITDEAIKQKREARS